MKISELPSHETQSSEGELFKILVEACQPQLYLQEFYLLLESKSLAHAFELASKLLKIKEIDPFPFFVLNGVVVDPWDN